MGGGTSPTSTLVSKRKKAASACLEWAEMTKAQIFLHKLHGLSSSHRPTKNSLHIFKGWIDSSLWSVHLELFLLVLFIVSNKAGLINDKFQPKQQFVLGTWWVRSVKTSSNVKKTALGNTELFLLSSVWLQSKAGGSEVQFVVHADSLQPRRRRRRWCVCCLKAYLNLLRYFSI